MDLVRASASVITGSLASEELTLEETRFLEKYSPAGLTLFGRNIDQNNFSKVSSLNKSIQNIIGREHPGLIMIDQEGGRVARLKGEFPNEGPAIDVCGRKIDGESLRFIFDYGKRVSSALDELGINVNFAPVVDILTEPDNDCIGDRVWGVDAHSVSKRAGSFLAGMQHSGRVIGCLKHFPGQGAATADTHKESNTIPADFSTLEGRELVPYRDLLSSCSMVMISHCIYSSIDPDHPASTSSKVMTDLLVDQLAFEGLVVSDDMTMGAIPREPELWVKACCDAISSGADLLLVCQRLDLWELAINKVAEVASKDEKFATRLMSAAGKVNKVREGLSSSR